MSDDIATKLTCDPTDFTDGMAEARRQFAETTQVIVQQRSAWGEVSAAAISAAASLADTGANVFVEVARMRAEMTRFAISTALAGTALVGIVAPATASKVAIAGGTAALIYHHQWLLNVIGLTVPGMAQVAGAVGLALTAYKTMTFAANDAASAFRGSIDGSRESIIEYNRLHGASDRLSESMSRLGESLVAPFREGTSAVYSYVSSFSPLPTLAGVAATAFDQLSQLADYTSKGLKSAANTAAATAFIVITGASQDASAAFAEQGQELDQLSKKTTAFIAKQEAARSSFQSLKAIQEQAAQSAANAAEVAKVSSIMTVEGIDQQIAALREKSTAAIMAGNADKAWEAQTTTLFEALAKQRQGIIDGTVVDKAAEEAKRALAKATEDAAKAAAQAAEKEMQHQLQGANRIESLKDQIDLLSKTATNADIAMREMWRQGFSQDQIDEVGKLTEELDRLKEAEGGKSGTKDKSPSDSKTTLKAAFAGSAEAASIMLRGVGGGQKMESLQLRQIAVTEKVVAAIESKEQPMLMAGSFGPGGNIG